VPLGARDVFIVIHAKDEASRVITGVGRSFSTLDSQAQAAAMRTIGMGQALVGMGLGLGAVGAAGIAAFVGMAKSAMEYNNEAALTLTQVDQLGVTLEDIKGIGKRVANEIPAPFNEMQKSLFDIFSSMDVNVGQAEKLLAGFSKGAVAGQVDVQTAGRSTIAIMNGFQLPAEDVNRVMDIQFQLVRKGVGTYAEFAESIGRVIPSAARAGQNVETMAGAMAFATRNGLSAQMAATSVARAFEAMTNQKVVRRLQEMGISALDGAGNFRQVNDVITDLAKQFEGLTKPEISARLSELFQGAGGTIQARRFIDLAIQQFEELNQRVNEMINSSGALEDAYQIMLQDPEVMMQALSNTWEILKTEIGDAVLPVLLMLATGLKDIFQWFNNLSPETKKWIAWLGLGASALLVLVGALLLVSGAMMIISGTLALFSISLGGLGLLFLGVAAVIAVAVKLIIDNWDTIKAWWDENLPRLQAAWDAFRDGVKIAFEKVVEAIQIALGAVSDLISDNWRSIWDGAMGVVDWFKDRWSDIWPVVKSAAVATWDWLKNNAPKVWDAIKSAAQTTWDWLVDHTPEVWDKVKGAVASTYDFLKDEVIPWFAGPFKDGMKSAWDWLFDNTPTAWDAVGSAVQIVWEQLQNFYNWFMETMWPGIKDVWDKFLTELGPIFEDFGLIIEEVWQRIQLVFGAIVIALYVFKQIWDYFWPQISKAFKIEWENITGQLEAVMTVMVGLLDIFTGLFTGDWSKLWEGVQKVFGGIWEGIVNAANTFWERLKNAADVLWTPIYDAWSFLWSRVTFIWNGFKEWLGSSWTTFWGNISSMVQGVWATISAMWSTFWGVLTTFASIGIAILGAVLAPLFFLFDLIYSSIQKIIEIAGRVWDALTGAFNRFLDVSGLTGPLGAIVSALDKVIGAAERVIDVLGAIPGVAAKAIGAQGAAAAASIAQENGKAWSGNTSTNPNPAGSTGKSARGGLLYPGRRTWTGEAGPEMIEMGTGGSYGRVIPHALAARTVSNQGGVFGGGGGTTLIVQGPIADREDLVYKAGDRMDWADFVRGR